MQLTSAADSDPPPDRATAAPIDTRNKRYKPPDTGATPRTARASTSPIWPRRRHHLVIVVLYVLYLRRRGAAAGALFFAVVATSRTRVCSKCYVLQGWQARSDAFLAPRSSARITFAHSESNEDLRTTNAPAEQGKRNHSAWHQFCAARPGRRASLRVPSGTYGKRGAGIASAVCLIVRASAATH